MHTISYLRHCLLYGKIDLTEALSHIKELAEVVECKPLLHWSSCELLGYWGVSKIPAYRLNGWTIVADYTDNDETFSGIPFPSELVDPGGKSAVVYAFLNGIDDEEEVQWDGKIYRILDGLETVQSFVQKAAIPGCEIHSVIFMMRDRFKRKVRLAVQEIMLNFILDLESEFGSYVEIDKLKAHVAIVDMLFRKAKNLTGSAGHLYLAIKPEPHENIVLVKGDDDAFTKWLEQHDVTDEEMDGFCELLLQQEENPPVDGIVPQKVYEWAKELTVINPRFGENGEKLIKGLKVFYGVQD